MKNIYQSFTYKMAAKGSWHRNYVTVTLCIHDLGYSPAVCLNRRSAPAPMLFTGLPLPLPDVQVGSTASWWTGRAGRTCRCATRRRQVRCLETHDGTRRRRTRTDRQRLLLRQTRPNSSSSETSIPPATSWFASKASELTVRSNDRLHCNRSGSSVSTLAFESIDFDLDFLHACGSYRGLKVNVVVGHRQGQMLGLSRISVKNLTV